MDNMRPLLSVVVPIYNVERYLHKCVDSILEQTLEEIEVILVEKNDPNGLAFGAKGIGTRT